MNQQRQLIARRGPWESVGTPPPPPSNVWTTNLFVCPPNVPPHASSSRTLNSPSPTRLASPYGDTYIALRDIKFRQAKNCVQPLARLTAIEPRKSRITGKENVFVTASYSSDSSIEKLPLDGNLRERRWATPGWRSRMGSRGAARDREQSAVSRQGFANP
ncbi:hypothetical protein KM043_012135 [Ampulex compressa]|nr:hypothetical protein KM043_012135 [Ampulex compressa]